MNLSQAMCKASTMRAISTMVHMCGLLGYVPMQLCYSDSDPENSKYVTFLKSSPVSLQLRGATPVFL